MVIINRTCRKEKDYANHKRTARRVDERVQTPRRPLRRGRPPQPAQKALLERALEGELTHHLGYDKHAPEGNNSGNSRNGHSQKRVLSKDGQFSIQVPRDRKTEFAPQIIKKNQRRFDGFDDKIISMYARGMTTREIQAHLEEIYSVEVSPDFISTVT